MDSYFICSVSVFKAWISRRFGKVSFPLAQTLGFAYQKSIWKYKERWLGSLFGLTSLFLGYWANQISEQEGIRHWEKKHSPSPAMVHLALESRQMKRLPEESSKYTQILYSVPLSMDQVQALWMGAQGNWVVSTFKKDALSSPQIYCRDCHQKIDPPIQWNALGIGWFALEAALEALDAAPQSFQRRESAAKKEPLDLRALVY